MSPTTKKVSKMESLTAALARAEAALAEAKARLQPQIEAGVAEVDALRKEYERTNKVSTKVYGAYCEAQRAVEARLFPRAEVDRLRSEIVAALGDRFPNANVGKLVIEKIAAAVNADPENVAASEAFQAASKAANKAFRAYNVANSPGAALSKLQRELGKYETAVADLKTEIDRLPRYRDAAKARREDAKAEQLQDEQTQAAREALAGFQFNSKVTP
jgi:predicted  nucleic acid-binding Zn-ribbon protein